MGNLATILLDEKWDFQVLFQQSLLDSGAGPRDLARFACTCTLARVWIRIQLSACSEVDIAKLLLRLPLTARTGRHASGEETLRSGELLWYNLEPMSLNGDFRIFEFTSYNGMVIGLMVFGLHHMVLTKEGHHTRTELGADCSWGFARFGMFSDAVKYALRPREAPIHAEEFAMVKCARLGKYT